MKTCHCAAKSEIDCSCGADWPCAECERLRARVAELEDALLHESISPCPECERLHTRCAELEKDAARYRWLRGDAPPQSERWSRWDIQRWGGVCWDPLERETLDAAIDAAIEGKL